MKKTEKDYIDIIGRTALTTNNYREKRWNEYYFLSNKMIAKRMLMNEHRELILDLGCSHGSWFEFWKKQHIKQIYGVDLSLDRLKQAKSSFKDSLLINAEGEYLPFKNNYFSLVISLDMFVHVLQLEDKLAIINEVYRILKPNGVFIFNFPPPLAYGFNKDKIMNYCSFNSLDTYIQLISQTSFEIEDISPSYFPKFNLYRKLLGAGIIFPFSIFLMRLHDIFSYRTQKISNASVIFIKLRK